MSGKTAHVLSIINENTRLMMVALTVDVNNNLAPKPLMRNWKSSEHLARRYGENPVTCIKKDEIRFWMVVDSI